MSIKSSNNSSPEFDLQYARLNKAQREAVDTIEGPVMVIAGPGTGKTTILTLRIANILRKTDTPAHGILAITYTDAGVKAMRAKLHKVIGNRAHEVAIHTFHSFAASMIAEYPDYFLHLDGLRHMSDVEQETLIRKIIEAPEFSDIHPLGKPDAYISAILHAIDTSKREALTPEMVRQHAEKEIKRISNDESSISTRGASKGKLKADALDQNEKCKRTILFAKVYKRYEEKKRDAKRMDFNDLIIELLVALRAKPDNSIGSENENIFLRLIQERFLYLLVDEHQDTNDAQNFIIALIAEFFETPNIFIVGDEKQAIYRFQGASVENFLLLQKRWPTMRLISLDTNYRSHQNILDASFSMIENNYEDDEHKDLRVELKSGVIKGKTSLRPLDVVTGENVSAIESYLVKELREISNNEPQATIAIITRRNRDLERIIRLLESNNIPVSSERSVDIFHHPVGALFFDLLEFLNDATNLDSLSRTIAGGLWGVDFDESIALNKLLRSGQTTDLENKIPNLLHLRRKMLNDGALGFIVESAEVSGFTALVAKDPSFVHVWRGIVTLAESIAREGNITNPHELIKAMLAYRISAETKSVKVSVGAPDLSIQAMTAHGSKGLEFDYVFLPYATEEAWIGRPRGASFVLPQKKVSDHDIRDTRRLFYVALTRAHKHVTILTGKEESDGKELTPLRFIGELDTKTVKEIKLTRMENSNQRIDTNITKNSENNQYTEKIINLAKKTILEKGLSVTALNTYIDCPSRFIYNNILRLPQAPSTASEKGTAMHEAMDAIWREKVENRTVENIENIIKTTVTEYLKTSFLSVSEKESIKKELFEDASVVATALFGHFNTKSSVTTERSIKTILNTTQGPVPLHGKLDVIMEFGLESRNDLLVFDYKTKQAMSDAEIKGETKNSTGDYFRQLTFYKLLLQDDFRYKGRHITPALVFISPDKKGRCPIITIPVTEQDIEKLKKQIEALVEAVWDGSIVKKHCGDEKCYWCSLRDVAIL